jgi:hypothetical protein
MNCKVRDGYQYGRNLGLRALRQGYAVAIGNEALYDYVPMAILLFSGKMQTADYRDKRKHGTLVWSWKHASRPGRLFLFSPSFFLSSYCWGFFPIAGKLSDVVN